MKITRIGMREKIKIEEIFIKPKLFIVQFHIQICTMNHKI